MATLTPAANGQGVPPPSPPVAAGPVLFQTIGCAQCHKIRDAGGSKGPELTKVGSRLSREKIEAQIKLGGGAMPAYGEVLTPEECEHLVRYLHELR